MVTDYISSLENSKHLGIFFLIAFPVTSFVSESVELSLLCSHAIKVKG